MAENQAQKPSAMSKRDQFGERLKKKYPDREYADDEALFGQIDEDYTDYDNQINQYREREQKFADMFTSDPRSAHFVNNWRNGSDPVVELVRQFGKDMLEAANDPERLNKIAEANKEFLGRVAKEKELDEIYQKNLSESLKYLEKFQADNGLSDEQVDEVMKYLIDIIGDGIMGKFSPESMNMALNAINHDADVANARTEGTVAGRNAKIEEKLRKPNSGDGTPNLAGSNNAPSRQDKRPMNIFDYADAAR